MVKHIEQFYYKKYLKFITVVLGKTLTEPTESLLMTKNV